MKRGSGTVIKEINLNMLRNAFKLKNIATKPQLAELTGLSVVTINSLVNILVENGEVIEDVIQPSNGGRPAAAFRFNSEFSLALIIYMYEENGCDIISAGVSDLCGNIIEKVEIPAVNIKINSFDNLIEEMIVKHPNIKVICFGIPGEEVDGKLLIMDYQGLKNSRFASYIEEKFKVKVLIENDMNAAVEGYCYSHEIGEEKCVVGIYFPRKYPPGSGIYINGKIYKGRNNLAGEIKYLPFEIDWENFDFNEEKLREVIVKTMMSFCCMYNPDTIVLYGDAVTDSAVEEFKNRCMSEIERIMIPEIVISEEFNEDFEAGTKQIALKALNPKLQ